MYLSIFKITVVQKKKKGKKSSESCYLSFLLLFLLGLLNVSSSFVVVLPAFSVGTLWHVITTLRHIHVDLQAML